MDRFKITDLRITAHSTKLLASGVLVGLAVIHAVMLWVFTRYNVGLMQSYSLVSICMLPVLFAVLHKEHWRAFAVGVHALVFAYVAVAVYCVGWDAGFQLALFAMIVLSYYSEYSARTMRVKRVSSLACSLAGALLYFLLLYYTRTHDVLYELPPNVSYGIRILWTVVFFAVTIVYLHVFMLIAHSYETRLTYAANHDKLTSLPNRNYASERLDGIFAEKGFESCFAAMIDIDDFKQVNDTHGHNCGDYVLVTIAKFLELPMPDCFACRWGGEEFLVVGRCPDASEYLAQLEDLRRKVEEHEFAFNGHAFHVTVTVGVAAYQTGWSQDAWINVADDRLYVGKRNGKNQVVAV